MPLQPLDIAHWRHYKHLYRQSETWLPYVQAITERHGLAGEIKRIDADATNPVFAVGDGVIVKLLIDGILYPSHTVREIAGLRALAGCPVPQVTATGHLFPEEKKPWPYLVTTRAEGRPLDQDWDDLDRAARLDAARQIGEVLREVHAATVTPELQKAVPSFRKFLGWRRQGVIARWRGWKTLPPHLLDQLEGFLARNPWEFGPEHVLHADLDGSHLFGEVHDGGWKVTSILDFGDVLRGPIEYDFVTLHLELFQADRELLAATGTPLDPIRMLVMALLHDYDSLENLDGRPELELPTLEAVAEAVFGLP